MKWEVIHGRGDVPTPREDHSAVIYEGSMVIFGGFTPDGEKTNEVYRYYFKDNKWEKVNVLG
jgi:N-acetylneuraminic acid mutarotase